MQTIDDFKQENKLIINIYNDTYLNLFKEYQDCIFKKDDSTHCEIYKVAYDLLDKYKCHQVCVQQVQALLDMFDERGRN